MKKHAIIPIFIPHEGCPNDCVFCNQRKITARQNPATLQQVRDTINKHLQTLNSMDLEVIEVAFYGGSFTGLPLDKQSSYLAIAKEYKDQGRIDKIHLSTRPDYISKEILDNLKKYHVDIIELGVQSFDEDVLALSNRGHNKKCIYDAVKLIKDYGFDLGIQLMIGLPGDTMAKCIYSAKETVKLEPQIARLYPTVVIDNTKLYEMYKNGDYTPLSIDEAVERTKAMYQIISNAGINIIRVGLKSSDIIMEENSISSKTFHPAFRQLVESEIAREKIQGKLELLGDIQNTQVTIYANNHSLPNAVGLNGSNRALWQEQYPSCSFSFKTDDKLKDYDYQIDFALKITITDSAGNITAYIHNPVDLTSYNKIANCLLTLPSYGIEQVAFIKDQGSESWDGRMEMAGQEFCGNATRSFGLMIAKEKSIKDGLVKIKTSGINEIAPIQVNLQENTAKIKMPMPKKIFSPEDIDSIKNPELKKALNQSKFVVFDGIFHVVVMGCEYDKATSKLIINYIKEKYSPPAVGVMYYDIKKSTLTPTVHVAEINSTTTEGSCCSGTTAVAYVLSQNLGTGDYSYLIKQPRGTLITNICKGEKSTEVYIDSKIDIKPKKTIRIRI